VNANNITTTAAPVPDTTTAAPVPDTTTVAPVPDTTTAAPVPDTTTVAPVPDTTTAAPVPDTTTVAPVPDTTTVAPIPDTTTAAPVPDTTTAAPVPDTTTAAPVPDTTTAAPVPDTTTAVPDAPTEAPTPTPSSDAVLQTYEVYNKSSNSSCLMMTMTAHVEYLNTKNETVVANVTSSYSVNTSQSNCNKLVITSGSNSITFDFKQGSDNTSYDLDQVDIALTGVHASKSALDVGSVSLKSSYVCATGETIKFENNSQLVMKDLQYQAIQIDGSKYATATTSCDDFSPIIPIIVGSILGALVLLVVVAYVCGRRRARTGYEEI